MFGLDVDTLREIRRAIEEVEGIQKVLIYGSRAQGYDRKGSDIDLTLIGESLQQKNSVDLLMDKLDELHLPYKFDISLFKEIQDLNMVAEILRTGQTFYTRLGKKPWPMVKLAEVCETTVGVVSTLEDGTVKNSKQFIRQSEDSLFSLVLTAREDDVCLSLLSSSSSGLTMRADSQKMLLGYLFYFFKKKFLENEVLKLEPIFLSLDKASMESLEIPLPPIAVQNNILAKIGEVEEKLNRMEKLYEKKLLVLKELKASSFKQIFCNG